MLHIYLYYLVGKIYQEIIQLKINLFSEVNKFDISTKAFLIHISRKCIQFSSKEHIAIKLLIAILEENTTTWRYNKYD